MEHTTQQAGEQAAMPFDPHYDAKQAFASLYVFEDLEVGHVQVQPVSRCNLVDGAPVDHMAKPGTQKFKQPKPQTSGCPVDVEGFPVDDPQAFRTVPTSQPQAATQAPAKVRAARFHIQITFGGKL